MPLYLTPLLTAMGWSWLGSPRSGMLNMLLHAAFGAMGHHQRRLA